ncbi:Dabb family protein [Yoonia sediminilitoris]|uniref:Stress responsive alpha/beta barrel protein n=1 Tax=Yoonia sediminilitoris TaxID=1286148 RepID=A0A2T6KH21_9RHOB|nr:Dabb family protein [Yoonia sediminilitoris]PUB14812.1 stress responsive alpha/beta barrel protein [Yoonia sediminilitoris]RCW95529.1 stress responsive alpha/beta barrel protein [Yoonia sediminilitoris]
MIKHIVTLDLLPDHDTAELQAVMTGLDELRSQLDGFVGFDHGPNRDFEGMSPGCDYGFICEFANEDTSRAYIVHPVHAALGRRLVALCNGGVTGITVVDLDAGA